MRTVPLTPLIELTHPLFQQHQVSVYLKRDDLNHTTIQGNKFHKLRLNLLEADRQQKDLILTFGGAYSNHIAATAAAGNAYGFHTLGLIRGEELNDNPDQWSPTLKTANENGMSLQFITRSAYRQKHTASFLSDLRKRYPNAYILPEGGTNDYAIQGFQPLMTSLNQQCPDWSHLFTAVGTGGTLAGMVRYSSSQHDKQICGVSVLKESDAVIDSIRHWTQPYTHWQLLTHSHAGGYAKISDALKNCQAWFESEFKVALDPIYTAKMVFGFMNELTNGRIPIHSKVVLYHSGGLQGRSHQPH